MATKPVRNVAYSLGAPLANMAPQPIVAQRDPTGTDQAEIGTIWVNTDSSTVFILASITAGESDWTSSSGSGGSTFTSVTIDPGNLHLTGVGGSIVVDDGDLTLTSGDVSIGGDLTMTGDLAVTGNVSISGGFTLDDTGSIVLTSTDNASGAISLITNGGTAETLLIQSEQGTGTSSVDIVSNAGGITLNAGLSAASALTLNASGTAGGIPSIRNQWYSKYFYRCCIALYHKECCKCCAYQCERWNVRDRSHSITARNRRYFS